MNIWTNRKQQIQQEPNDAKEVHAYFAYPLPTFKTFDATDDASNNIGIEH